MRDHEFELVTFTLQAITTELRSVPCLVQAACSGSYARKNTCSQSQTRIARLFLFPDSAVANRLELK